MLRVQGAPRCCTRRRWLAVVAHSQQPVWASADCPAARLAPLAQRLLAASAVLQDWQRRAKALAAHHVPPAARRQYGTWGQQQQQQRKQQQDDARSLNTRCWLMLAGQHVAQFVAAATASAAAASYLSGTKPGTTCSVPNAISSPLPAGCSSVGATAEPQTVHFNVCALVPHAHTAAVVQQGCQGGELPLIEQLPTTCTPPGSRGDMASAARTRTSQSGLCMRSMCLSVKTSEMHDRSGLSITIHQ
jgi:hypothetical protein